MKLFTTLLLLFAALATLNAQIRLDIVCGTEAEKRSGEWDYKNKFNDSLSLEKHLMDVIADLQSRAYLEASVDSIVYSSGNATAYLHKGRQYNRVKVSLDQIDDQVMKILNIRAARYEREALSISAFRNLQNKIMTHYENSGYPFATISLSRPEINQDTIRGRLVVKKNHYYNIDSIHIYGDAGLDNRHLYRHIAIHPGDPYSEARFRKAGEIIRQTPFLNELRKPEMEFMSRSADLYLYIDRQQASSFSGVLGIMPGGSANKIKLAGELNLNLMNVFSRMERISLEWKSPGNQVQQMDVDLGQPYLFGRAFGLDLHLHIFRQDSTYMNLEAEAGIPFTIPNGGVIKVFGRTTGTSLIAAGAQMSAPDAPAAEVSGRIFGLSYRHSRMDNMINPYRGWQVNVSLGAGNKKVKPPAGFSYHEEKRTGSGEAGAQMKWFVPFTPASTIVLANLSGIKFNIGTERDDNYFFANELFLLGGIHSIRGFDERSLAASAYSIQRLEYRYLFDAAGNMFLFFDGMAYKSRLPHGKISDMPFGFGAGLTFDTRAGQFSISYALGREFGNPVSFRSSRIHMGIVNRF